MRSSKTRSRGKPNRGNNRSPANNLNRVFDSSGPEGKVRGTPQQIIDKYTQLARDAFMSSDRVVAENFQQHAEHYTRMLAEAQRDAEEKRLQAEQQNRERQQQQQKQREQREPREDQAGSPVQSDAPQPDLGSSPQPDVVDVSGQDGETSGLVETPESAPKKPSRSRKPRAKPKADPKPEAQPEVSAQVAGDAPEAAE